MNVPFKILKTIQKLGTPKWLIDTDCKDCWEPHPHIFPSFLSWKSCNCPALQCASLFWQFQLWAIKSRDGQWSMMDINHIRILKPPRKSVSSNLAFSQDMLLSESIWYILSQIGGFAPASTSSGIDFPVTGTKNDMGNWLNLGDHICSNCHEENEVQSIGKGGGALFSDKTMLWAAYMNFWAGYSRVPPRKTIQSSCIDLHGCICIPKYKQHQPTYATVDPSNSVPGLVYHCLGIKHAGHIPTSRIV